MESYKFIPVKKRSYQIQAMLYGRELLPRTFTCPVLEDTFTLEEGRSRIIMYGLLGEQYPISDEKFCATYQNITGEPFTPEQLDTILADSAAAPGHCCPLSVKTYPGKDPMWAIHVPLSTSYILKTREGYEIPVNGSGVEHGDGDYIVCPDNSGAPNLSYIWAVNGRVFHRLYEVVE